MTDVATTYFSGLASDDVPADPEPGDRVLGVVRRPREFVADVVDRNVEAVAPPDRLLDASKRAEEQAADADAPTPEAVAWDAVDFAPRYRKHLKRPHIQQVLGIIVDRAPEDGTLWLVCWERDVRYCHRKILAAVLAARLDTTVTHIPDPKTVAAEQPARLTDFTTEDQ